MITFSKVAQELMIGSVLLIASLIGAGYAWVRPDGSGVAIAIGLGLCGLVWLVAGSVAIYRHRRS